MIRKVLMGFVTILLSVLMYFLIVNGISIGNFNAYGITN